MDLDDEFDESSYREDLELLSHGNNKALINVLSQVAEEHVNGQYACRINELIVERHNEVPKAQEKLNILYLIDSIIKNVGGDYVKLFKKNIVKMFEDSFDVAEPELRQKLFKLRRSWSPTDREIPFFPKTELSRLDVRIRRKDPGWPIADSGSGTQVTSQSRPALKVVTKTQRSKSPLPPKVEVKPTPPVKPIVKKVEPVIKTKTQTNKNQQQTSQQPTNVHLNPAFLKAKRIIDGNVPPVVKQAAAEASNDSKKKKAETERKKKKIELEGAIDIKTDEIADVKNQIKAYKDEKNNKSLAEKSKLNKKIVDLKKKLIDLESEMEDLNEKKLNLDSAPLLSGIGTVNRLDVPDSTTPTTPPVVKVVKKIKKKPKNVAAAEALKQQLTTETKKKKQPNKKPSSDTGDEESKPKKKVPRIETKEYKRPPGVVFPTDLTQPKVTKLPTKKIPKKDPLKASPKKAEKVMTKPENAPMSSREDDAPDILDPEASDEPISRKKTSGKAPNIIRGGQSHVIDPLRGQNPSELLKKAKLQYESGLMSRTDYDNFCEKVNNMAGGSRSNPRDNQSDPRRAGSKDRDNRTPWYEQGVSDPKEIADKTGRDYRNNLWERYWANEGRPGHHGPPPHDYERSTGQYDRPARENSNPRDYDQRFPDHSRTTDAVEDEWDPLRNRRERPIARPHPYEQRPHRVPPAPQPASVPPPTIAPVAAPTTELSIAGIDFAKILEIAKNIPDPNVPPKVASQTTIEEERKSYVIIPEKPSKPHSVSHTPPIDRVKTPEPEQESQPISAPSRTTYDDDFDDSKLPRVEFNEQACKTRIESLVKRLYSGMPCTACGLRFLQSQTTRYADHLDFHYRQNRKEREGQLPTNRSWYYSATEWLQYEEIEDAEQRAISSMSGGGKGEEGAAEEAAEEEKASSTVPINKGDNKCAVCHEPFESFFHQDEEEWHYKDCIIDEKTGKLMHVQCANDAENILEESLNHRTREDSIASVDETELKELETVKEEPDVKQEMMETETAEPEEQSADDQVFKQEAETSMECVNNIVNEDQAEQSLEASEDLYGDLAGAPDLDDSMTGDVLTNT